MGWRWDRTCILFASRGSTTFSFEAYLFILLFLYFIFAQNQTILSNPPFFPLPSLEIWCSGPHCKIWRGSKQTVVRIKNSTGWHLSKTTRFFSQPIHQRCDSPFGLTRYTHRMAGTRNWHWLGPQFSGGSRMQGSVVSAEFKLRTTSLVKN